tara:strand:+ start:478 stop:852 length:375 start_codon:yes stop_codon:yes gene_type:complete
VYAEAARTTKGGLTSVIEGQRKAHAAALALRDETHAAALKSHLAAHDAHLARAAEAAASTEQRLISELAAYKEEHETVRTVLSLSLSSLSLSRSLSLFLSIVPVYYNIIITIADNDIRNIMHFR